MAKEIYLGAVSGRRRSSLNLDLCQDLLPEKGDDRRRDVFYSRKSGWRAIAITNKDKIVPSLPPLGNGRSWRKNWKAHVYQDVLAMQVSDSLIMSCGVTHAGEPIGHFY